MRGFQAVFGAFEGGKGQGGAPPSDFFGFSQPDEEAGPVAGTEIASSGLGRQAKHPRGRLKRRGCLFGCGWKRSTEKVASGQAGFFAARAL